MAGGMFSLKKPQLAKTPTMGAPGPENKYATSLGAMKGGAPSWSGGVPAVGQNMQLAKGALPNASPAGQLGAAAGARNAQMQMQQAKAQAAAGAAAGRQAQMARGTAVAGPPTASPEMQARMASLYGRRPV